MGGSAGVAELGGQHQGQIGVRSGPVGEAAERTPTAALDLVDDVGVLARAEAVLDLVIPHAELVPVAGGPVLQSEVLQQAVEQAVRLLRRIDALAGQPPALYAPRSS